MNLALYIYSFLSQIQGTNMSIVYVKVTANPVNSLAKQGFGIDMQNKGLSREGKRYKMPRSVERAIKAKGRGDYVEPFRFILEELSNNKSSNSVKVEAKIGKKTLKKVAVLDKFATSTHNKPAPKVTWNIFEPPISPPQAKYVLTDSVISFFHAGQSYSTSKSNPMFDTVVKSLKNGDMATAVQLCNIASAVDKISDGVIKAKDGVFQHNDIDIHESASDWILRNMHKGKSAIQPIVNFLGRVKANEHKESVEGLWRFIRECGLIITSEGKFICYKYTRDDMKDVHSGTLDYSLGNTVEMNREDVEFNPNNGCGKGIHGASEQFVNGHSTIIELMIDPVDVVSVPYDCSSQKLRCCRAKSWKILKHKGVEVSQPTKQEEFFILN